jgi:hypothetical protein
MKNDPAFPIPAAYDDNKCEHYDGSWSSGMTMLEYYAGHALANQSHEDFFDISAKDRSEIAFRLAEVLCEEAEKRRKNA